MPHHLFLHAPTHTCHPDNPPPAGVKLHRQAAELLGSCGLQHAAALRATLAGRGGAACTFAAGGLLLLLASPLCFAIDASCQELYELRGLPAPFIALVTQTSSNSSLALRPSAGVVAAALAGGGLHAGLLALLCLLWLAGLPAALPYAALAALLRWQLRATALMWHAMRGKRSLPLLRNRLLRALRGGGGDSGGQASLVAAGRTPLVVAPAAGAAGLKQLSGSMLLFMPLLLLLPTTAWFYGFALALHAAFSLPRCALRLAAQLAREATRAAPEQPQPPPEASSATGAAGDAPAAAAAAELCRYQLLQPRISTKHLSEDVAAAAACTTFLLAAPRRRSAWQAAAQTAAGAWAGCQSASPWRLAAAVLLGQPLWLGWPPWL